MNQRIAALTAIAVVIPLAMSAVAYSGSDDSGLDQRSERFTIVASFYPIYEFTTQVAGNRVEVTSLMPAGIEPHDWEPTALDVSNARSADLIIINGAGFEGWAQRVGVGNLVDTSSGIDLGSDEPVNSHLWLDPVMAKHQVEIIRNALVEADPANAGYYIDNAAAFTSELDSLNSLAEEELGDCARTDFIAFHDAFFHFARRYNLIQHSLHGGSPEGEILPQRIAEVVALAKGLGITVIYSEELVDDRLAKTIAQEIPAGKVLVLSPIEGIDEEERARGIGYVEKMKENIANLKEGLGCR